MKWVLALCFTLAGCTFDASDIGDKNACTKAEDCLQGRNCVEGRCVDAEDVPEPDPDAGVPDAN